MLMEMHSDMRYLISLGSHLYHSARERDGCCEAQRPDQV